MMCHHFVVRNRGFHYMHCACLLGNASHNLHSGTYFLVKGSTLTV